MTVCDYVRLALFGRVRLCAHFASLLRLGIGALSIGCFSGLSPLGWSGFVLVVALKVSLSFGL